MVKVLIPATLQTEHLGRRLQPERFTGIQQELTERGVEEVHRETTVAEVEEVVALLYMQAERLELTGLVLIRGWAVRLV
jgi:hypothetical protein